MPPLILMVRAGEARVSNHAGLKPGNDESRGDDKERRR